MSVVVDAFRINKEHKRDFITSTSGAIPEEIAEELDDLAYFMCPAGRSHHGAYVGGLYEHSRNVAQELSYLTSKLGLTWERPQSPVIIGFLHDICKTYQYDIIINHEKPDGYEIRWNKNNIIPGHGEASVYIIQELEVKHPCFKLTDEEKACIRYHMGAYTDKSEWDTLDTAIKRYPNIIYTHMADMFASKIIEKH
ncbi:MAG: HD domain-containing protein [Lachnospiraceae bacterium]